MTCPSSSSKNHQLVCIISLILFLASQVRAWSSSSSPSIGVRINPSGPGVPSTDLIVSAMESAGIHHVLLQDPKVKTLRSFLYTNISLLISLSLPFPLSSTNNGSSNSTSYTLTRRWISTHILPFHPRIHVSAISIGPITPNNNNNISSSSSSSLVMILTVLRNFRSACIDLGLPNIPISTVHSDLQLLRPSSFPPSSARFQQDLRPLLEFLNSTGSPFLVDLNPFQLYRSKPAAVPIGYVLFLELGKEALDDEVTGLRYCNMFDATVDSLITALEKTGYGRLPIVVTGTGWPTAGAKYATPNYSFLYNKGLVDHLRFGLGTPMRREGVKAVYLRDLFDDPSSTTHGGEDWESHWGIWFANLTHKYEIDFSSSSSAASSSRGLLWATFHYWSSPCLLLLLAISSLISQESIK